MMAMALMLQVVAREDGRQDEVESENTRAQEVMKYAEEMQTQSVRMKKAMEDWNDAREKSAEALKGMAAAQYAILGVHAIQIP